MLIDQVAAARARRDSSSVVFSRFLAIRSEDPELPIAIIEGKDDVGVWSVWFARSGFNGHIELLPCGGKEKLFELKGMISRSRRVKDDNVVYVFDRDYDDWAGNEADNKTFMTDMYSIENYFVSEKIVDHILNNYFACAGDRESKNVIIENFNNCLSLYIEHSRDTHLNTFINRRILKQNVPALPKKFREIVTILEKLNLDAVPADDIKVHLPEDLNEELLAELTEEFNSLPFIERARGKYHRLFMEYFFSTLQSERLKEQRYLFSKDKSENDFKYSRFNIVECAGVSALPLGLDDFTKANLVKEHDAR